jgi:hypothetical protein
VLSLPEEKRVDPLPQHLRRIRVELARSAFHGSAQARDLDERIEEFLSESLHADLGVPAIPG